MLIAMANMGIITDLYPKARSNITLVAAPVLQESATSCTGLHRNEKMKERRAIYGKDRKNDYLTK